MQFLGPADNYDRFMGRYAPTLSVAFADAAGVRAGVRVLDVGCGRGGLTRELVARAGAANVAAIDPAERFTHAGLEDVAGGALSACGEYAGFDDFWEPFTLAVGPSGQYLRSLPDEQQNRVRDVCRAELPDGEFTLNARAWYARGTVPAADAA